MYLFLKLRDILNNLIYSDYARILFYAIWTRQSNVSLQELKIEGQENTRRTCENCYDKHNYSSLVELMIVSY